MKRLQFLAGYRALKKVRDAGLSPADVKIIPGAAGGPKWLVLSQLDRAIFGGWLKDSPGPVDLIGASAGAWRFAALTQDDPVAALEKLEHSYINQRYSEKPPASEVSRTAREIIGSYVPPQAARQILESRKRRLHIVTARSRHLTGSDNRYVLGAGFAAAAAANTLNRGLLGLFLKRVIFHHPGGGQLFPDRLLNAEHIPLSEHNLPDALLATGSIPFVMERVAQPAGSPAGSYRDGGLVDYHMDLPFELDEGDVVLYPHFVPNVVPGWLDKALLWRRGGRENLRDVIVVCPSEEFVESLPMEKIPDRSDFYTFKNRADERIRLWEETVDRCRELADEFLETVTSGRIREEIEPL